MKGCFGFLGSIFISLFLVACGGAMGDSTDSTAPSGKVTLVLTDAPSDAFESVEITINSITFLGSEGQIPVPLPEGEPVTVDLLELDGLNMLLAQADIPEGAYHKIRLQVSDPNLVLEDGIPVSPEDITLVAGGKIDLVPQGSFHVIEGEELVIQLDFDVENSLHIHETGNGKFVIRPVVLINIQDGSTPDLEMVDAIGVIQAIDYGEKKFLLRLGRHLTVRVHTTDETIMTDSAGNHLIFDDLEVRQKVEVVGDFTGRGIFHANSIEVHRDHVHRHGVIKDLDLNLRKFVLIKRDLSEQVVSFDEGTLIHIGREILTGNDLANAQRVKVAGTIDPFSGKLMARKIRIKPEHFRGLIASPPQCPDTIQVVNPRAKLYRLRLAGIVLEPENTIMVQIGSARLVNWNGTQLDCADLAEGDPVFIQGRIIPHTPDSQDPNPIQVLAKRVKRLKQAHVIGEILSIHPDPQDPQVGTFVLGVNVPGIYWSTDQKTSVILPIRVLVTHQTTFDDGMMFGTLFEGQKVEVRGFFSLRRFYPHLTLVAVHVGDAPEDLTNLN